VLQNNNYIIVQTKKQQTNQRQRQSSTEEQLKICESNYMVLYNQMKDKQAKIQDLQYNIKIGNTKIEQYKGIINENEIAYSELQQD